jgi:hypothetical protein
LGSLDEAIIVLIASIADGLWRVKGFIYGSYANFETLLVAYFSAASRMADTMFWYPVQRQRLPLSSCLTVASSRGPWAFSMMSIAVMIKPGVQKPH